MEVYAGNYTGALTDLSASFLDIAQPMSLGVYHSFSENSGDQTNPLFDPLPRILFGHSSNKTDAQRRADGSLDLRYQTKVADMPPVIQNGIQVDSKFTIYDSPSSPIPIIRNEELILLRAEANLALGNNTAAIQDINLIRANSGGLAPISDPYVAGVGMPATLLDELLYEKRYSLLWEGGHRWIDLRRYGKLATLPKYAPDHKVFPYLSLPPSECQPRSAAPYGCTPPAGF